MVFDVNAFLLFLQYMMANMGVLGTFLSMLLAVFGLSV